jgi:hypothetical protein
VGHHLFFASGRPDILPLIVLELDDLRGNRRPAIQESHEVLIQLIDLASQAPNCGMSLGVGWLRMGSPIFRTSGWLITMGRLPFHGSTQKETFGTVATRIFDRQQVSRWAQIALPEFLPSVIGRKLFSNK